jgi:hypothetical protein
MVSVATLLVSTTMLDTRVPLRKVVIPRLPPRKRMPVVEQGGPAATPRQTALYLTSLC